MQVPDQLYQRNPARGPASASQQTRARKARAARNRRTAEAKQPVEQQPINTTTETHTADGQPGLVEASASPMEQPQQAPEPTTVSGPAAAPETMECIGEGTHGPEDANSYSSNMTGSGDLASSSILLSDFVTKSIYETTNNHQIARLHKLLRDRDAELQESEAKGYDLQAKLDDTESLLTSYKIKESQLRHEKEAMETEIQTYKEGWSLTAKDDEGKPLTGRRYLENMMKRETQLKGAAEKELKGMKRTLEELNTDAVGMKETIVECKNRITELEASEKQQARERAAEREQAASDLELATDLGDRALSDTRLINAELEKIYGDMYKGQSIKDYLELIRKDHMNAKRQDSTTSLPYYGDAQRSPRNRDVSNRSMEEELAGSGHGEESEGEEVEGDAPLPIDEEYIPPPTTTPATNEPAKQGSELAAKSPASFASDDQPVEDTEEAAMADLIAKVSASPAKSTIRGPKRGYPLADIFSAPPTQEPEGADVPLPEVTDPELAEGAGVPLPEATDPELVEVAEKEGENLGCSGLMMTEVVPAPGPQTEPEVVEVVKEVEVVREVEVAKRVEVAVVPRWMWVVAALLFAVMSGLAFQAWSERQAWLDANIAGDRMIAMMGPRGGVGEWGLRGGGEGWPWLEKLLGIDRKMPG